MSKLNNIFGLAPKEIRKDIRGIRKILSSNEAFLENRWRWYERLIVWCSKHVPFAVILLIITFVLLAVLLKQSEYLTDLEAVLDLPSTIFQAQVTMLSIIFPIIIGFVAILLQGKPYNEPIWKIYKRNSGFMFAIFSFLALTTVFILYQLFRPWWLSDQVLIAASFSIGCWFIVNLLLSGWFFGKTIQFLSPNRRLEMIAKYIINEIPPYAMWVEHFNQEQEKYVIERRAAGLDPSELPPISNLSIPQHFISTEHLFLTILSEVETTLKDNNPHIFRTAKNSLVEFCGKIIASMSLKKYKNELNNLLLSSARVGLMGTHIDILIGGTHQISKSVVRKIQDDENYYRSWCYFYINLFDILEINMSEEMAKIYIQRHYDIWEELVEYINNSNLSEEKKHRVFIRYKKSWSSWSSRLIRGDIGNKRLVDTSSFSYVKEHLDRTSCMLISAVAYKNFEAAERAINILNEWFEVFKRDYTKQALLRNYWVGIRFATAAYLMNSPKYPNAKEYKKYIYDILDCKEPGTGIDEGEQDSKPISSTKDILDVYLRQNDYWRTDNQRDFLYVLSDHFEKLSEIEKPIAVRLDEAPGSFILLDSFNIDKDILPFYQVMGIGWMESESVEQLSDPNWLSKWKDLLTSMAIPKEKLGEVIKALQRLKLIDDSVIDKVCYQFDMDPQEAPKMHLYFMELIDSICDDWRKSIN